MPSVKHRLSSRISSLTLFSRFEVGLVRGREPPEGDPESERKLRAQVSQLQAALSESQAALSESQAALSESQAALSESQAALSESQAALSESQAALSESQAALSESQTALDDSKWRLDLAQWQLTSPTSNIPQRWFWTTYIVSDKHRFVFLATYKVATTSILLSLLPLFDFDVEGENFDNLRRGPKFKHKGETIEDIHDLFSQRSQINKAHFLAGMGNEYHRYFKFAFVRNPWDRLVSCYMSKIVQGGTGMPMGKYGEVSLRSDMTFDEFAEAVCQVPDEVSNTHFRSQHVTICDDGPEKTVLADFVGRFENLEEDFRLVAEKIGLNTSLPYTNKSGSSNLLSYRDFYDERLARRVGERYREDADLFGYSF